MLKMDLPGKRKRGMPKIRFMDVAREGKQRTGETVRCRGRSESWKRKTCCVCDVPRWWKRGRGEALRLKLLYATVTLIFLIKYEAQGGRGRRKVMREESENKGTSKGDEGKMEGKEGGRKAKGEREMKVNMWREVEQTWK